MLLSCFEKKDTTESNEWRKQNGWKDILLKWACLDGVNLKGANLEGVNFSDAYLKGADLSTAHLEGSYLYNAHLENSNFEQAIVDGSTLFWTCHVDHNTNFHGVTLDCVRVDTGTKQLLEYNIRWMN